MWSTVTGVFSNFNASVRLVPPSIGGSSEGGWSFEESSQLNIAVSSLITDMGTTADGRVTSTMEADKHPWMSCRLEGPILQKGKTLTAHGTVTIREVSQVVAFKVEVDPKCTLGDQLLRLKVTASMDRYEFDVCPSWPSAALARELRMTAVLVFIADERNTENPSQKLHPPETAVERVAECPEELHPPESTIERMPERPEETNPDGMAEHPESLHPPETRMERPSEQLEESHPPETNIERSAGHAEDVEPVLEAAPQASALESNIPEVSATVECDTNVEPSAEKPEQELEQDAEPVLEVAPQASALESNVPEVSATVECDTNIEPSAAQPEQELQRDADPSLEIPPQASALEQTLPSERNS